MIRGKNGDWALVEREKLAELLDALAHAASFCPDYFCDTDETIKEAEKLVGELR